MKRVRLIQEELNDPWQMLVACIMLNRTKGTVVRRVLWRVLARYDTPEKMSRARHRKLSSMLEELGLQNIKAARLIAMSKAYGDVAIEDLPGIGKYATDSWQIFIEKKLPVKPDDKQLKLYLARKRRFLAKLVTEPNGES